MLTWIDPNEVGLLCFQHTIKLLLAFAFFSFFPTNWRRKRKKKENLNLNERTHSMLNICITIPGLSLTFNIAYEL